MLQTQLSVTTGYQKHVSLKWQMANTHQQHRNMQFMCHANNRQNLYIHKQPQDIPVTDCLQLLPNN